MHISQSQVLIGSLGALVLGIALIIFLTSPSLRIGYHRAGLRNAMSRMHDYPKRRGDYWRPRFWIWQLEGRPSPDDRGMAAQSHQQALLKLGYFAYQDFYLNLPWGSLPFGPAWLTQLSAKSITGTDWPDVRFAPSPSNTTHVSISGPIPLLQHWERMIDEHDRPLKPMKRGPIVIRIDQRQYP